MNVIGMQGRELETLMHELSNCVRKLKLSPLCNACVYKMTIKIIFAKYFFLLNQKAKQSTNSFVTWTLIIIQCTPPPF